jgi:glycosyltransferase involved in cell wall biosynthesis
MSSFTLIIATIGEAPTLNRLLASLARQETTTLECIVVDQNPDDRLESLLDPWRSRFKILRLRCAPGASRARNLGLLHATGDIIAFPDDDCWYSAGLLPSVEEWFHRHPHFDIFTVGARDENGVPSGNRWLQSSCEIRSINVFRTTFCSSIFLRRAVACGGTQFDETIGPGGGTRWSCGDETDFILDLQRKGARGFFDRRWYVGHPRRDMLSGEIDSLRAAGYGRGMGHVLRKHSLYLLGAGFVVYDLGRAMLTTLMTDLRAAALCLHHARGVVAGLTHSAPTNSSAQRENASVTHSR